MKAWSCSRRCRFSYSWQTVLYFLRSPQRSPCPERRICNLHCFSRSHYEALKNWYLPGDQSVGRQGHVMSTETSPESRIDCRNVRCSGRCRRRRLSSLWSSECVLTGSCKIVKETALFPSPWHRSSTVSPSLIMPFGDSTHKLTEVEGSETQMSETRVYHASFNRRASD